MTLSSSDWTFKCRYLELRQRHKYPRLHCSISRSPVRWSSVCAVNHQQDNWASKLEHEANNNKLASTKSKTKPSLVRCIMTLEQVCLLLDIIMPLSWFVNVIRGRLNETIVINRTATGRMLPLKPFMHQTVRSDQQLVRLSDLNRIVFLNLLKTRK